MTEEYEYARRLATSLANEHWPDNTGWEPLPDLMGVLTQIDNMTTLMRDQKRQIEILRSGGGPAFAHGNPEQGGDPGMSLRDWFAGQALEIALSGASYHGDDYNEAAMKAYAIADAMLSARKTEGE